jgi:hypothetical protein
MSKKTSPTTLRQFTARVLSKIAIEPNGCWRWHGGTSSQYKYPSAMHEGVCYFIHRFLFEQTNGPVPKIAADGTRNELHHRREDGCIGKMCVNPRHLRVVSARAHAKITAMERKLASAAEFA